MSERWITIHGHFYQPPRENPWLEAIERQESAYPYHDWNARISAECYAPNAWSRILDREGRITRIINNYERISFNIGPTLLAWMEQADAETYRAILAADEASRERFGGHGSAIAQAYGHLILPLANRRDKQSQVQWGVRDFEHRFGRRPEGMWLPETAVDIETLEALAAEGIAFTILAPHQAARVRPLADGHDEQAWCDVTGSRIDRGKPYLQRLPSGNSMVIFFYEGTIARAVAFEGLLNDGGRFADTLMNAFVADAAGSRIVHIATDGESYGHHHKRGEMALSYALQRIDEDEGVVLTNYGQYLDKHPPEDEVQILDDTSWSCAHGIERWRSDCGCNTGGQPGWNQSWRAPLRTALDWLRDELEPRWEEAAGEILIDPWEARDRYIEVILDRSGESLDRFFSEHGRTGVEQRVRALRLLELQRHLMLMYTSCGWFFSELSGIETVQVIQYAGRAVQLAVELFDDGGIEEGFLARLAEAKSNIPEKGDGRKIYQSAVVPARVDLKKVGAHYAVSSLFEDYPDEARVYCYSIAREDERREETGRARLALGRASIRSVITCHEEEIAYAVVHLGDHNVVGGAGAFRGEESYEALVKEVLDGFGRADFPAVIRLLDERFAASTYSLKSLFRDEQRKVIKRILESSVSRAAGQLEQIYENRAPLMRFMADLGIEAPRPFRIAAEFVINTRLRRAFKKGAVAGELDGAECSRLVDAARAERIELAADDLAFAAQQALESIATRLAAAPEDPEHLDRLEEAVGFVGGLPFPVQLWRVQNTYYRLLQDVLPGIRERADGGDISAAAWAEQFEALGEKLQVAVTPSGAASFNLRV